MGSCWVSKLLRKDEVAPTTSQSPPQTVTFDDLPKESVLVIKAEKNSWTDANFTEQNESANHNAEKERFTNETSADYRSTNPKAEHDSSTNQNAPQIQLPEVEIQRVPDGEGNLITLGNLFGIWTAPWPTIPAQIVRMQQYQAHENDIVLIGYPKSGTHWMWEMVNMLLKGRAEHSRLPKERLMLSFSTQEFFDMLEPPRVFNTHTSYQGLPPTLKTKHKIIYLIRNPKDVCVLFYHMLKMMVDYDYDGSFHGFVDLFLEGKVPGGSWLDYVLDWEMTLQEHPDLPVLVVHYENIIDDPVATLRRLSAFLGSGASDDLLIEIEKACSIERMKAVDSKLQDPVPQGMHLHTKSGKNIIYRKEDKTGDYDATGEPAEHSSTEGIVGDWKTHFSTFDDDRFTRVINTRLAGSSLRFCYDLEEPVATHS